MNRTLEKLIKKNSLIKLFSLIFAMLIWIYVIGGIKHDVTYSAGIKIYSLPKGYAISNTLPKKILVELRGSRITFMKFNKKLVFKINGSSLLSKKNTVVLGQSYLNLPSGIIVVRIYPKIIPVTISRVVTKYIKILPITKGRLKKGYYIRNIIVFPQYVEVKGPKDIVNHLSVITTQKILLDRYSSNKTINAGLLSPTKFIKILYNKKVSVSLIISRIKKNG